MLRLSGKPDFPGRVYQRRKLRNKSSSAVWKVKPGYTIPEAGTSQSREKKAVSSLAGVQDSSPAFEELLSGDSGEPDDLQLADCQAEEATVSGLGQESNSSPQSGLRSNEAGEATGLVERGFDAGLGISRALSAEGGGLTLDPQVYSQQLNVGLSSSGFGEDPVNQRQEDGSLELVIFPTTEGLSGVEPESFSGGPSVGNCL